MAITVNICVTRLTLKSLTVLLKASRSFVILLRISPILFFMKNEGSALRILLYISALSFLRTLKIARG